MSVQYQMINRDGQVWDCDDYCFRGTFAETQLPTLCEGTLDGESGYDADGNEVDYEELEEQFLNDKESGNIVTINYLHRAASETYAMLREVYEAVPWIRDFSALNEKVVSVDMTKLRGDHAFNILSTFRNLIDYFGQTYLHWRKTYNPYDAFFLTMFTTHDHDYNDQLRTHIVHFVQDYMWARGECVSREAAKYIYHNGPIFRSPVGIVKKDTSCGELGYYRFGEDDRNMYIYNRYLMADAFALSKTEEPKQHRLLSSDNDKTAINYLKTIIRMAKTKVE